MASSAACALPAASGSSAPGKASALSSKRTGTHVVAERLSNDAGVVVDAARRAYRARAPSARRRRPRSRGCWPAAPRHRCPSRRCPCAAASSSVGECQRLGGVAVVVEPEQYQLAVVDLLVERGELGDELDGRVLLIGRPLVAAQRVEIAQGGECVGLRRDGDRRLVAGDCVVRTAGGGEGAGAAGKREIALRPLRRAPGRTSRARHSDRRRRWPSFRARYAYQLAAAPESPAAALSATACAESVSEPATSPRRNAMRASRAVTGAPGASACACAVGDLPRRPRRPAPARRRRLRPSPAAGRGLAVDCPCLGERAREIMRGEQLASVQQAGRQQARLDGQRAVEGLERA